MGMAAIRHEASTEEKYLSKYWVLVVFKVWVSTKYPFYKCT